MNEIEIIENLKSGSVQKSEETLRFLYKKHYQTTKKLILKNSGNIEDAKDVFQEVMIGFYEKIKRDDFKLNCKISTFLYAMSRNQWLKRLRDKRKIGHLVDTEYFEIPEVENKHSSMEYSEQQIMLAQLLKVSGEKCLRILKAFYFEKMSMQSIADELNYSSEQVVRNQKSRCIKKIKSIVLENKEYQNYLLDS